MMRHTTVISIRTIDGPVDPIFGRRSVKEMDRAQQLTKKMKVLKERLRDLPIIDFILIIPTIIIINN